MKHIKTLIVLLACACGGEAPEASGDHPSEAMGSSFGWCCEGICGLSGEDADAMATTCTCEGIAQAHTVDGKGDCIEAP